MDACYYLLIRRTSDAELVGWVPDLPGITASGVAEEELIRRISCDAKELLHRIVARGLPLPAPSPSDELPLGDRHGPYRRLLLVLG